MAFPPRNILKTSDEIADILDIEFEVKSKQPLAKEHGKWIYEEINIAVVGQAKSGKSSFINHVRNVNPNDKGAAKVNITVNENTTKRYQHPKSSKIYFWEFTGLETKESKQGVDFDKYDFFLVLSEKTFLESDSWFVQEILQRDRKCYFVRTCTGRSIKEHQDVSLGTHDQRTVLEEIRSECKRNLEKNGIDNPVIFLTDSYDKANNYFEFGMLQDQLITVAESTKQGEIPFSFDLVDTDSLMNRKKQMLTERIHLKGLEAARATSTTETNLILKQEILLQQRIFGIDKDSLNRYESTFQLPVGSTKQFMAVFEGERNIPPSSNVIVLVGSNRGIAGFLRKGFDTCMRVTRGEEACHMYRQCMKILERSLQIIFTDRDRLNRYVLTHLVREKRSGKQSTLQ